MFEELRTRPLSAVIALDGNELYLVRRARDILRERALEPIAQDFNFDRLSGKTTNWSKIMDAAAMLPVFASKRLVWVEQTDELLGDSKDENEDLTVILDYVQNPNPTTILVLEANRFDARTKLYKLIQKQGGVFRFESPKPKEMPGLIEAIAQEQNTKIKSGLSHVLAGLMGTDVTRAAQTLEILALYAGEGQTIDREHVREIVSDTHAESVFELVDALSQRGYARAFRLLDRLMRNEGEHPLRLIALFARHFRQLLNARSFLAQGKKENELAALVGVPPFLVRKLAEQARQTSARKMLRSLRQIAESDHDLKGGSVLDNARIMERLILRLL